MTRPLIIFFDGGARPNPGRIEVAAVTRGRAYVDTDMGVGDNNDAEWLALIHAAGIATSLGAQDAVFIGDSAFVVDQARGAVSCRAPASQAYLARFRMMTSAFTHIRIRRVARSKNLAGIALAARHPR